LHQHELQSEAAKTLWKASKLVVAPARQVSHKNFSTRKFF